MLEANILLYAKVHGWRWSFESNTKPNSDQTNIKPNKRWRIFSLSTHCFLTTVCVWQTAQEQLQELFYYQTMTHNYDTSVTYTFHWLLHATYLQHLFKILLRIMHNHRLWCINIYYTALHKSHNMNSFKPIIIIHCYLSFYDWVPGADWD